MGRLPTRLGDQGRHAGTRAPGVGDEPGELCCLTSGNRTQRKGGGDGGPRQSDPCEIRMSDSAWQTAKGSRLLLLARIGSQGHVAGTSALPPTTDIRAPMSAFVPISSASPPGADLPGGVAEGPFLTLSRPSVPKAIFDGQFLRFLRFDFVFRFFRPQIPTPTMTRTTPTTIGRTAPIEALPPIAAPPPTVSW